MDLFEGWDLTPKVILNWSSSKQVIEVAKLLGFNTAVQDKKTGEDKDSVLEKHLKSQKGINDKFLELYFNYQEHAKEVSSFGQGHLDAINPITGRLHTTYRQLGTKSGRMASGSKQTNEDLERYKKLPKGSCKMPNMQQLPGDEITRGSFVAPKGHFMVSADFAALEARLGADIYNEPEMLKEFIEGSGDMHSLCAKMVFSEELKDIEVKDIKKLRPDLRKKVKSVEFAKQFGGTAFAIASSLGCSLEEAQNFSDYYDNGFKGVTSFKRKGSKEVREKGYVLMSPITGHKMYWWDWNCWKKRQKLFDSSEWDWNTYRTLHKGTGDSVHLMVKEHFKAASKWDRMALNAPTQGGGAIIIKHAAINLFNWIVDHNYFNKIHLCAMVHDEVVCDYPEEVSEFPKVLETVMEEAAAEYCKSLSIPAEAAVGDHWIH
jgi:DNA polymerase-1